MLKIAFSPIYHHPLPEGHRFPMEKYSLIPEQLLYEGTITSDNLFAPEPIDEDTILLTHDADYWRRLKGLELTPKEIRRIGFPLSERLVERCITIARGTVDCALIALENGIAMNVAGGTHHAHRHFGEGFCLLNDVAIAANYLLHRGLARRILIIDLDVHQGNGSAQIFAQEPRVFTFSMHGEKNFPMHKEQSDLDIGLPDETGDQEYLATLEANLELLPELAAPDFVFYISGVDVLASDKLGRLSLSLEACKTRDRMVFAFCRKHRLPVAVSMGGGYSPLLSTIVEAHANTFRLAQEMFF